jgi:hypothetical protein
MSHPERESIFSFLMRRKRILIGPCETGNGNALDNSRRLICSLAPRYGHLLHVRGIHSHSVVAGFGHLRH